MKAVEIMRQHKEHRGGVIYQISSLAGLCSFPGNAYYHAGKYAVEGCTESVAREMHPDWNSSHGKSHTSPHPAYTAPDMPALMLEKWVNMGIKSGVGMLEPTAIAETIYMIANRGEKLPLRLPLGPTTWKFIRQKYEGFLGDLDAIKDISAMRKEI
ncbi:277094c1-d671-4dab-8934-ef62363e827f [Sclerotinia trifoliorum]|uniref:277094c1-d671-4dab-8934-ef62363e827f n=1 Tax=Sclerotinia trifoliorum TaxID=28548 RepID=A0A8H2ZL31_9HELO|nr:277094c1-d671-4dab-8934-ef62363e827f [Sclerotinia trifoliorum]